MDVTLEITKGSRKTRRVRLKSSESYVGRREDCDVRIPSARVSRRHCRLTYHGDLLHVEDLHSSNGTFLNGEAVSRSAVVKPGDLLEIGPVQFRVNYPLTAVAVRRLNGDARPMVSEEDVVLQSNPVFEELEPILLEEDDSSQSVMELEPVLLEEDEPISVEQELEPVLLEEEDAPSPKPALSEFNDDPIHSAAPTEPHRDTESKPQVEPLESSSDGEEILPTFDDDAPWVMPEEDDLRDILSKLEE